VSRPDPVAAAREAGDADFNVLIACAFNYDAHFWEFDKLGCIPVLKVRMNADLHMADLIRRLSAVIAVDGVAQGRKTRPHD
jgi:adenine-specific DNA-methyltransferase